MLSQKLYNFLLNTNYTLDDSMSVMSAYNNSMIGERKEQHIRARTMNRREPTLSHNVTLLIEFGMVAIVMTIVGLVFYFSQRNFKKRSNVHRRRWLDSDINIDNYSDGQIYDTNSTLEECQSQPIDLDQDDCPPPYESVVQQSKISLKKMAQNFAKCSRNYKHTLDASDRNSSKWQWTYHDELQHNTNSMRNSDPLIASQSLNCISTISNENSLLIENRRTASTSSPEEDRPNRDEECTIRGECFKDDFKVDIHRLQNALLVETEHKDERFEIVPTKTVGCENEFALLDASGLPSYDTALKIQECGNM